MIESFYMNKLETYSIAKDIDYIKEIKKLTNSELASFLNIGEATLYRYYKNSSNIPYYSLDKIYNYAYENNLKINTIKSHIYEEEYEQKGNIVIYHGSKKGMIGSKIDLKYSDIDNDFGIGLYCGESITQPETFVINYPKSSLYMFTFNPKNLKKIEFKVDTEWVLAIAYYRGYLEKYKNHRYIKRIIEKINNADYIVAPIADNTMFDIIKRFTDGELSDVQCQHSLSATNLGKQYVFKSQKAIDSLIFLNKCFISSQERKDLANTILDNKTISENKVNYAISKYRKEGKSLQELLNDK